MLNELKKFLIRNKYPFDICWSEDATRITGGVEYKSSTDSLSGLVAPMDINGMPLQKIFHCSSPAKVIEDMRKHPVGRNVHVCMAQPMMKNSAPFCTLFFCTDNKFSSQDVMNRWNWIKTELDKEGIRIVCKASDGDTRFISAMMKSMELPCNDVNPYGDWFKSNTKKTDICIQDPTHLANKFRTRLMKRGNQLILGNKKNLKACIFFKIILTLSGRYQASTVHLIELIRNVSKDQHGLTECDLSEKDKMNFRPVIKLTSPLVVSSLKRHVPSSEATIAYLNLISCITSCFMDTTLSVTQRLFNIW